LKLRPYRAGLKVGSVQRRLNAIAQALKAMGLDSPTSAGMLRNKLKGPRRSKTDRDGAGRKDRNTIRLES
jgi:hypothetical protein